jgi:NAD(P)-dependent dehydrogenase (short-subunit alcohol dehydrogenase family)
MRSHRTGVIANVGSIAGWTSTVGCGLYCASKFALVGITEALRAEVAHLGISVTIIEPGYFRTGLLVEGKKMVAGKTIEDLKPVMEPLREMLGRYDGNQPGDPVKGAQVIVEALTGTGRCKGKQLPVRLVLGRDAVEVVEGVLERERREVEEWRELAVSTDFEES